MHLFFIIIIILSCFVKNVEDKIFSIRLLPMINLV